MTAPAQDSSAPNLAPDLACGKIPVRSLFISDLHLGYKGADVAGLMAFLARYEFRHLYLVGDIIDGWKLEKRWFWPPEYSAFLAHLLTLRRQDRVRVTFLTGNHDEKLREFLPALLRPVLLRRFGIRIEDRIIHHAADGRRYLILHGDQFDARLVSNSSKFLDALWVFLSEKGLIRPPRMAGPHGGRKKRWSLRKAIEAAPFLGNSFAHAAAAYAARDGFSGVICGHSHVSAFQDINGCLFANCGSWLRNTSEPSAIIETLDGEMALTNVPRQPQNPAPIPIADDPAMIADIRRIETFIRKLWHERPKPASSLVQ